MGISRMSDPVQAATFDKNLIDRNNNRALVAPEMKETDVLQSWKDISRYLERDIRTCHRWERELGLPVHRVDENSLRSKVFAYKSEIDQWLKEKANNRHEAPSIWKRKRLITGLVFGLFLLSAFFASLNFFKRAPISSSSEPTIAVFPFENHSFSEYEEYFSEGITNEIVSSLIRLNKIRVVPAAESGRFEYTPESIAEIRGGLKADYFLFGEMEKNGDNIRINISLIRGKDNKSLWNQVYDRGREEIFSVKEDICQKVHEKLGIGVDHASLLGSGTGETKNYRAYDTYLKGNYILNRIVEQNDDPWKLCHEGKYYLGRLTQESNEMAISLFNKAVEVDSSYALAYIGLAHCYAHYVNFVWDSDIEWLDKAEDLLEKAQKISPDLDEYYNTLIEISLLKKDCFDESTGEVAFDLANEAIEKYPNHPQLNAITGYCYLSRFGERGDESDFDKALEYKERSFLLNPSDINNIKFVELLMLEREFYKALEVCNFIERAGSSLYSKSMLGEIYYYSGDLDKSREIFLQFDFPLNYKIYSLFFLAMIAAQRGEIEEALELIQKIETLKPEEYGDFDEKLRLASVYFGLGNEEQGYQYIKSFFDDEHTEKEKYIKLRYIEIDRNFDAFRNEERFKKITRGE
jgi:TolB-like protein/Tfp pilus assembly protein PilF